MTLETLCLDIVKGFLEDFTLSFLQDFLQIASIGIFARLVEVCNWN